MSKKEFVVSIIFLLSFVVAVILLNQIDSKEYLEPEKESIPVFVSEEVEEDIKIVFDDLTFDELVERLNKNLHSDLSGAGYFYAKYSLQYGIDPYLAVAISLHETGCNATCSALVYECNNVGGQKFRPTCYAGGSMGRYDTLEQGIEGFIRNIAYNYYEYGLNTAELMQAKYVGTGSQTWAPTVNKYIDKIKSS